MRFCRRSTAKGGEFSICPRFHYFISICGLLLNLIFGLPSIITCQNHKRPATSNTFFHIIHNLFIANFTILLCKDNGIHRPSKGRNQNPFAETSNPCEFSCVLHVSYFPSSKYHLQNPIFPKNTVKIRPANLSPPNSKMFHYHKRMPVPLCHPP